MEPVSIVGMILLFHSTPTTNHRAPHSTLAPRKRRRVVTHHPIAITEYAALCRSSRSHHYLTGNVHSNANEPLTTQHIAKPGSNEPSVASDVLEADQLSGEIEEQERAVTTLTTETVSVEQYAASRLHCVTTPLICYIEMPHNHS